MKKRLGLYFSVFLATINLCQSASANPCSFSIAGLNWAYSNAGLECRVDVLYDGDHGTFSVGSSAGEMDMRSENALSRDMNVLMDMPETQHAVLEQEIRGFKSMIREHCDQSTLGSLYSSTHSSTSGGGHDQNGAPSSVQAEGNLNNTSFLGPGMKDDYEFRHQKD